MLAADDGDPKTLAAMHEITLVWDDPHDVPDAGKQPSSSMFPIAEAAYHFRRGAHPHLPGVALVSKVGRADAHVAVDAAGEPFIFTKSDGVIRVIVGATVDQ